MKLLNAVSVSIYLRLAIANSAGSSALFDGESLDGWKANVPSTWRVRYATIVGGSPEGNERDEYLVTEKSYRSFWLRLEYKLSSGAEVVKGAVLFRSHGMSVASNEMSGYQVRIGGSVSGCLYEKSPPEKLLATVDDNLIAQTEKKAGWNICEIQCKGPRIQVWLNGVETADYTELDPDIREDGVIGLQIKHDCKGEIAFRNISIEEFSSASRVAGVGNPPITTVARPPSSAPGKLIYDMLCRNCHQPDGKGLVGFFPPLAGSEWVVGDKTIIIKMLLHGLNGPITVAGHEYGKLGVAMPPSSLTDQQIADVLTFIRSNFGHQTSSVERAEVERIRLQNKERQKFWTVEELLK